MNCLNMDLVILSWKYRDGPWQLGKKSNFAEKWEKIYLIKRQQLENDVNVETVLYISSLLLSWINYALTILDRHCFLWFIISEATQLFTLVRTSIRPSKIFSLWPPSFAPMCLIALVASSSETESLIPCQLQ